MRNKKRTDMGCPQIAETDKTNYSVHTITYRAMLAYEDKVSIEQKLMDARLKYKKEYFRESNSVNFMIAGDFGFNNIKISSKKMGNDFSVYWMDIKINPRRMFHENDHPFVYIADTDEIIKSYEHIQEFLDETKIVEIDNQMFYIQRADYCVNIDLGSKKMVKEYMRLMKKGAYPYGMKRKMEYSSSGKREVPTRDSFTVSSKAIEFSVYDKCRQLEKQDRKYPKEEIQEAEGMVRIELRVKRSKIRYDGKKNKCKDVLDQLRIMNKIAADNIPRYLKLAYGTGGFVKYKKAKKIIENSSCKNNTKKMMINILKTVSLKDLETAKRGLGKSYSKYVKKFNELGISPITIEKGSDISKMQNPLYYIKHHNKNHGL